MAPGWAQGRVIVWVTLSVAGSILVTAAPVVSVVLATQIAPPPLAMAPGSPPTGTRATSVPVLGSMRDTWPAAGSATHTEPSAALTAPGGAGSRVTATSRPEAVLTAASSFAPENISGAMRAVDAA